MGLLQIKVHVVFYNSKDYGILDNLFLKEVRIIIPIFHGQNFRGGGGGKDKNADIIYAWPQSR